MYYIKGDNDVNQAEFTMFDIYNPNRFDEGYIASSMQMEKELNKAGSFRFVIQNDHPQYNNIFWLKTTIIVYSGSYPIWYGRVVGISTDFYKAKTVSCEGALAFLSDIYIKPFLYSGVTPGTYIDDHIVNILRMYHSRCSAKRNLTASSIDTPSEFHDKSIYNVLGVDSYTTVYDELSGILNYSSNVGLSVMYGVSGTVPPTLIIAEMPFHVLSEGFRLCESIRDLSSSLDGESVYSSLIPLDDNNNGLKDGTYHVDSQSLISEYGVIEKVVTLGDISNTSLTRNTCNKILTTLAYSIHPKLSVKALDFFYLGINPDAVDVGYAIPLYSEPHEINEYYLCTHVSMDLANPEDASYSFEYFTPDSPELTKSRSNSRVPEAPTLVTGSHGHDLSGSAADNVYDNFSKITRKELQVAFPPSEFEYTEDSQSYIPPDPVQGETYDTITAGWDVNNDAKVWGIGVMGRGTANEDYTRIIKPDGTSIRLNNF